MVLLQDVSVVAAEAVVLDLDQEMLVDLLVDLETQTVAVDQVVTLVVAVDKQDVVVGKLHGLMLDLLPELTLEMVLGLQLSLMMIRIGLLVVVQVVVVLFGVHRI